MTSPIVGHSDDKEQAPARHLVGHLEETKANLDHVLTLTPTRRWARMVGKTEMTILMIGLGAAGEPLQAES